MSSPLLAFDFDGDLSPDSSVNAPVQLLERLRLRGVVVESDGAKLLLDAPRGVLDDLLPDVQKFKPQLLELLQAEQRPRTWRDRDTAYWERVRNSVAPGTQKICRVLQDYCWLFDQCRQQLLPLGGCRVIVGGHSHNFESAAEVVGKLLADWSERAARCSDEKRNLTPEEESDLTEAKEALEWLTAANNGDRWLDLVAVVSGNPEVST